MLAAVAVAVAAAVRDVLPPIAAVTPRPSVRQQSQQVHQLP